MNCIKNKFGTFEKCTGTCVEINNYFKYILNILIKLLVFYL
ncbi:hypothetical protein NMT12_60210 [metagenome]